MPNTFLTFLGQSTSTPTLGIDVVNSEELQQSLPSCFDELAPGYLEGLQPTRWRGDLSKQDAVWGFSPVGLGANRTANAVALTGERLVIKINTLGHGVGTFSHSNQIVFTRSTLTVTVMDVLNGTEESLTFTDFTSDSNDDGRFLLWQVKEETVDSGAFEATYGVHGVYLVRVSESVECFWRADWTDPVDASLIPPVNQSYLQVLTLSWNQILREMHGGIIPSRNTVFAATANLFGSAGIPLSSENEATIFDTRTIYPLYRLPLGSAGYVDLTSEEKVVVIRDSALTLATSQLPILTADVTAARLLGVGMKPLPATPVISPAPTIRLPPAVTAPDRDTRRFGLIGQSASLNTLYDSNDIVQSHALMTQSLFDPIRCFAISGSAGSLMFLTSGSEVKGVTAPTSGSTREMSLLLDDDVPVVGSVGISFNANRTQATVSVEIVNNSDSVESIGFGLAIDGSPYETYADPDPTHRSFTFDVGSGYSGNSYATFYAQVSIFDTQNRTRFYYAVCPLGLLSNRSVIVNLKAYPRQDGSEFVDIYYDAMDIRERSWFTTSVSEIATRFSGDIGTLIPAGTRHVAMQGDYSNGSAALLDFIAPEITATSNVTGATLGEKQYGVLPRPSSPAAPFVQLYPAGTGSRFGIYDGSNIKTDELPVEIEIQSFLPSSSSSHSLSSLSSSSSSSSSSLDHSESSQSLSSESSESYSSRSSCSSLSSRSSESPSSPSSPSSLSSGLGEPVPCPTAPTIPPQPSTVNLVLPLIEGDTFACNDNLTHKVPAQTASLTGYSGAGYCIWSAGGTDIGYEVNGSPVAYNIGIFTVGWMDDGGVCKWGIGFIADDCDNLYGTWEKLEGDTPYGIYTLVSGVGYMPATLEVTA